MSASSDIAAKKWARTIQDIQKKSYWVIGLLLLGFSAYFYYTSLNKPVAGVLWFIGGFLIVYYYWLKWFVLDRPYDPDFFTALAPAPTIYLLSLTTAGYICQQARRSISA